MTDHISHSAVECYQNCPKKYKFRYIDNLKTFPNFDSNNPLILGTALHKGLELGTEEAIEWYKKQFPIIDDSHIEEIIKLKYWIPKARAMVPNGQHEVKISVPPFIGFIDLLTENEDGTFDIWDFKYAGNPERYKTSGQLSIYGYYLKQQGKEVKNLHYLVVPKTNIRKRKKSKSRKKDETEMEFRKRIIEDMQSKKITIINVPFSIGKVADFLGGALKINYDERFKRNETGLCKWCEYEKYCQEGDDIEIMNLPKCERRTIDFAEKKKIWVYGAPFSGKTVFADKFPKPLMLNTDGNIHNVTAPYIPIKDEVRIEGRRTERTFAWSIFKDAVLELEKKDNEFETIVLDLVEDLYESCRQYMYNELGLEHESDDPFRAWDKVRGEFFTNIKRFMNLDYKNIIIISHEDMSKDITKRGGDKVTAIKPNIQDKIANKLAGMVDIVVRAVRDGENYELEFGKSDVVFGGGRLVVTVDKIDNSYEAICEVYEEANEHAVKHKEKKEEPKVEEETKEPDNEPEDKTPEEKPEEVEPKEEEPKEEEPKRRGRRRKVRDEE